MKKETFNIGTLPISFNRNDISKVIKLLEKNGIFFILNEEYFDEKSKMEYKEIHQDMDFKKAFTHYLSLPQIKRKRQYNVGNEISNIKDIVPRSAMRNHLRQRASFKSDTRGIDFALNETLERMIEEKFIEQISPVLFKLYQLSHSGPIQ